MADRPRRNDVSFITKDNRVIILIEHQSTLNQNMALRLFFYYVELLHLWIKSNAINIYGTQKIDGFPMMEFYVVYNGKAPLKEDISTFEIDYPNVKINIKAKIFDIHHENINDTTPENALSGYSFFYKIFDMCKINEMTDENAFAQAREECIKHGYMKNFIEKEAYIMFYKEYMNYDKQIETLAWEKGVEEGKAEGEAKSTENFIRIALRNNIPITIVKTMATEANIPQDRLDELLQQV